MTASERVVRGSTASEHFVQLCDSHESMASAAAAFLTEAHRAGDVLLVVAREMHWIGIHRALTLQGINVGDEAARGRLIAMDARTKLSELSRNGRPNAAAFDVAIGNPVRALASSGGLSIYGEMVDVLAEHDEIDAALALEHLWNTLAEQTSFRLMCGYSSAHFVSRRAEERLRDVCRAHTRVHSSDEDPLGNWLVKRSQEDAGRGAFRASRH